MTTATINDFEQKGFSKYYYYVFVRNIDEVNTHMNFEGRSIQEVYDEMVRDILQSE